MAHLIFPLEIETEVKKLRQKPFYEQRYQPQPIQEILKWIDYFLVDFYYWNQTYVDYYILMLKKSKMDFSVYLDKIKKGLLDGLVFQKLSKFPIVFLGDTVEIQYEIQRRTTTVEVGLITAFFEPQIGDLFVYRSDLFMIQTIQRDIHRLVWRCKQEYIGSQQNLLSTTVVREWYTEDDIKTLNTYICQLQLDVQLGKYVKSGIETSPEFQNIQKIVRKKDKEWKEWLNSEVDGVISYKDITDFWSTYVSKEEQGE